MVTMEITLELQGKMTAGLGSALMRRFANGESFFPKRVGVCNPRTASFIFSTLLRIRILVFQPP